MFVAWRELWFARGRFGLLVGVVGLITVLVGLLSGLTAGLAGRNTSAVLGLPGDHVVFAGPDAGFGGTGVDEASARAWAGTAGVRWVEPLRVEMGRAVASGRSAAVAVFAVPVGSGLRDVEPGSAVVAAAVAQELGVRDGERITLGDRTSVARVANDTQYFSHAPVVWVPVEPGSGFSVLVLSTSDCDIAAADQRIGTATEGIDDAVGRIGSFAAENGSLVLMRGFLFAISALVVGAFFTVWTIQRSPDTAVLKALGASTAYLLRDALGQAAVLLVLGTAIGTGIAAAVGALLGDAVPFVLDPATLAGPAAVLVGLGLAGAALAIRRVTSVDPLTALGSAR
ncbi:FtsX-like permease family protein [Actinokineospora terrae]|uniref:Putative ABC transport system permease protein n=1 Tax=Actinokineospora terrae TaxID=155974 RepID=A0A1H9X243_9PSEU|nr:ABC transporter permease [Actinokineospora terrae]SES39713.1 putative ABC transport system permease protein [Actinokineospora terrae]